MNLYADEFCPRGIQWPCISDRTKVSGLFVFLQSSQIPISLCPQSQNLFQCIYLLCALSEFSNSQMQRKGGKNCEFCRGVNNSTNLLSIFVSSLRDLLRDKAWRTYFPQKLLTAVSVQQKQRNKEIVTFGSLQNLLSSITSEYKDYCIFYVYI